MNNTQILKGTILYLTLEKTLISIPNGYIVSTNGLIDGVYSQLPNQYDGIEITDYGDNLIIPGFCDMHVHAPQYHQRGVGMDLTLLDWLNTYTFPNEASFKNEDIAIEVYTQFVDELVKQGTLSAAIFATVHTNSTVILCDLLEKAKIQAYVGKVNMDMNCPEYIIETTEQSLEDTKIFLDKIKNYKYVKPIITPRFSPSCSQKLHQELGILSVDTNTPVQSHLCESHNEIEFVKQLFPDYDHYSQVYHNNKLLGPNPSIMAHCIYLSEVDKKILKDNTSLLVHCPTSNSNIITGIMKAKELMSEGFSLSLGTDVGGGHQSQVYKEMASAIRMSKILSYQENEDHTLSFVDTFFMATVGGGTFFKNTGTFEQGFNMTALVIDDSNLGPIDISPIKRLERFCYIGDDRQIKERYSIGCKL